jgi:hypothetical protein
MMREELRYPIAFLSLLLGVAMAWLSAWMVNIVEWLCSISIGELFTNLIFADANGLLGLIISFITMFPYVFLLFGAIYPLRLIEEQWLRKVVLVILVILILLLFDPHTKSLIYPYGYREISYLQDHCYFSLFGGLSLANLEWTTKFSRIDYYVFDFYMIAPSLLILFNDDYELFHD